MSIQTPPSRVPTPLLSAILFFLAALGYLLLSSHGQPMELLRSLPTAATRITVLSVVVAVMGVGVLLRAWPAPTTAGLTAAVWGIGIAVAAMLVLSRSVQAAVAVLVVMYAGRCITSLLLRLFGKRRHHDLMSFEAMLEVLVGLGVLSVALLALLVTRTLYQLAVVAVIFLPIVAEWKYRLRESDHDRRPAGGHVTGFEWRGLGSIEALSMTGTAAVLLLVLIQAISPEIQYDALRYHLTLPARFLQAHGYTPTPGILQSWFVSSSEMLYTIQLTLGGEAAAKLLNFAILALLLAMVYAVARRHHSQRAAAVATLLTAATPIMAWLGGTAKPDAFSAAFCFAAFGCFCEWRRVERWGWLAIGGLCAGLAVSFKLTSILFVAVLLGVLIGTLVSSSERSWGQKARALGAAGGAAILGGAPWFVFRFALTGNPVFPFLNGWFHSPLSKAVNEPFAMSTFGVGHSPANLALLPLTLISSTGRFAEAAPDGSSGALPVAILWAALVMRGWKCGRFAVLVSILTFAAWAASFQYLRFLMPFFPVAALAVGAAMDGCALGVEGRRRPENVILGLALALILGVSVSRWIGLYWQIPERIPLGVATGAEDRTAYLGRVVPTYDAHSAVNQCRSRSEGRLLAIGDEFHFLSQQTMYGLTYQPVVKLLGRGESGELMNELRRLGVSHILINWWAVPSWATKALLIQPEFLDARCRLEFARNGVEVYEVLSVNGHAESRGKDGELVRDSLLEEVAEKGASPWVTNPPAGGAGQKGAGAGAVGYTVMGTGDSVCQVVGIGETERLRLYGRCEEQEKVAALRGQLTWLAGEGRRIETSVLVWSCDGGLRRHSMAALAPPGAELVEVCGVVQSGKLRLKELSLKGIE